MYICSSGNIWSGTNCPSSPDLIHLRATTILQQHGAQRRWEKSGEAGSSFGRWVSPDILLRDTWPGPQGAPLSTVLSSRVSSRERSENGGGCLKCPLGLAAMMCVCMCVSFTNSILVVAVVTPRADTMISVYTQTNVSSGCLLSDWLRRCATR